MYPLIRYKEGRRMFFNYMKTSKAQNLSATKGTVWICATVRARVPDE